MIDSKARQIIKPNWQAPANVVAFTTTRQGGVSERPFDSFNLGMHVGDNATCVQKNRALLQHQFLLPSEPAWLNQTHSTKIIKLTSQFQQCGVPEADGAYTNEAGKVCLVMTADCLPLLLCDQAGTQVAAVHAGWQGLADGIVEQAVKAFDCPPEAILAWAGPCISKQRFEIGGEVKQRLGGTEQAYKASKNKAKYYADLSRLTGERLAAMGVSNYSHNTDCTYADKERFFSYRRDHDTGRMVSVIYLDNVI